MKLGQLVYDSRDHSRRGVLVGLHKYRAVIRRSDGRIRCFDNRYLKRGSPESLATAFRRRA